MIRLLEELLRITVYGAGGYLAGYTACLWINDQHRLTTAILGASERDMPASQRRLLTAATLQSAVVILVMVALLLTGITWLHTERDNAAQDRRDCLTMAQITSTLQGRTANYRQQALAEQRLWKNIRRLLGDDPNGAASRSIDEYLRAQQRYLLHLANNPYPRGLPEDC